MKFKEKDLVAIKVTRVFNNVVMQTEYIKRTYADYLLIKDSVQKQPELFELNIQREDKLKVPPKLKFHEDDFGYEPAYLLKGRRIPTIAEMRYSYKTPYHLQNKSYLGRIILSIVILAILMMIFNIYVGYKSAEISEMQAACRIIKQNGTPRYMTIDGMRYDLNAYGKIIDEQKIFVNPWHAEQISSKDNCKVINFQ